MGNLISCCKDDYESEWYYSRDSLPPLDIEAKIEWSNTPYNSPLSDKEIAKLFYEENKKYNKWKL